MAKIRGFEIDKTGKQFEKKYHVKIQLPRRSTSGSAGYDIRALKDIVVPSYTHLLQMKRLKRSDIQFDSMKDYHKFIKWCKKMNLVTVVPTGIKAYCKPSEFLAVFNRSSNPPKRGLILANGVGVIDSDYYGNPSNDGELCAEFINLGMADYTIHAGDRIMQGVFLPYLLADHDNPVKKTRKGGLGSTGVK